MTEPRRGASWRLAANRHTGRGGNPRPVQIEPTGKVPSGRVYFLERFSMGSKSRMATPV